MTIALSVIELLSPGTRQAKKDLEASLSHTIVGLMGL